MNGQTIRKRCTITMDAEIHAKAKKEAKKTNRTLSGMIEWALQETIKKGSGNEKKGG
jgi:hypothetical protein